MLRNGVLSRLLWSAMLALAGSTAAQAWNDDGHQMIALIAHERLTPNARAQVEAILGSDIRSLEAAAIWADCVRGVDKSGNYVVKVENGAPAFPACAIFESDAGKAQMEDYVARSAGRCDPTAAAKESNGRCHDDYHYVNLPLERDSYDDQEAGDYGGNDHDVVHAIAAATAYLSGKPTPAPFTFADKREALLLLVHVVGDIHQPLHVGSVYLEKDTGNRLPRSPQDKFESDSFTRGGNLIGIVQNNVVKNLHSTWDGIPNRISPGRISEVDFATLLTTADSSTSDSGFPTQWPRAWANDTLEAAKIAFKDVSFSAQTKFTSTPKKAGEKAKTTTYWPYSAPSTYAADRAKIQEEQIAKGGARLARLLNAIFDPPEVSRESLQAVLWTQTAVEYEANTRAIYAAAGNLLGARKAAEDSASLEQIANPTPKFPKLPAAIILDLDETVLDNSPAQARVAATGELFDEVLNWSPWLEERSAKAVPGAIEFLKAAEKDFTIFYVTNRACMSDDRAKDASNFESADKHAAAKECPNLAHTMKNLEALGAPRATDPSAFLLKYAHADWGSKGARRTFISQNYRVAMMIGDDLRDFVERDKYLPSYARYWGERWFLLPNPQYGSWTGAIFNDFKACGTPPNAATYDQRISDECLDRKLAALYGRLDIGQPGFQGDPDLDTEFAVRWRPAHGGPKSAADVAKVLTAVVGDVDEFKVHYITGFKAPANTPAGATSVLRIREKSTGKRELMFKFRSQKPFAVSGDLCPLKQSAGIDLAGSKAEADVSAVGVHEIRDAFSYSCKLESKTTDIPVPAELSGSSSDIAVMKRTTLEITQSVVGADGAGSQRQIELEVEEWALPSGPVIEISMDGRHTQPDLVAFRRLVVTPIIGLGAQPLTRSMTRLATD